jgi:hypothetical protein
MLESVKRAYDRGVFNGVIECPIDLKTIEIYLQILAPAYRVSVGLQKTSSTISDILPSILALGSMWEKMELEGDPKRLCRMLVLSLNNKFKSERESNIVKVYYCFKIYFCFILNPIYVCFIRLH